VELERQVNELKAKCEQMEKRAQEQRQVEEKKHAEEIQFLKRTNQQLKVWLHLQQQLALTIIIIIRLSRIYQRSQTSAKHSAATWWVQRT